MFNDNKDFYPTPPALIKKMLEPYTKELRDKYSNRGDYIFAGSKKSLSILEPSAGKGDILDFITKECNMRSRGIYAIEAEAELSYALQGKGYKVIHNDFLTYSGDYKFDLIIMNPPFSQGAKHLLKAWEIAENTDIVCLLNAETIRNTYTQERKLLADIIKLHGSVEYIQGAFSDGERKTNVETALVRLKKVTEKTNLDFQFENVTSESGYELSEEAAGNAVMMNDITGNMLRQYEKTKQAYIKFIEAKKEMEFYAQGLTKATDMGLSEMAENAYKTGETMNEKYNIFIDDFKMSAWKNILSKLNIEKYLTNSALKNFQEWSAGQGCMDLTRENIHSLIMMLVNNQETIYEQAIIDVFDIFTKYHKENREHVEGWVSNSEYMVSQKVVLPNFVEMSWSGRYSTNSYNWDKYADIDKVMAYISGVNYDDFNTTIEAYAYGVKNHEKQYKRMSIAHTVERTGIGDSSWQESEFFYIRCYKKGTLHIKFKDEALWLKFNEMACKGKFGLPLKTRKKKESRQAA